MPLKGLSYGKLSRFANRGYQLVLLQAIVFWTKAYTMAATFLEAESYMARHREKALSNIDLKYTD